jgi:eukaryotic-like serine/threonine-protein kinase
MNDTRPHTGPMVLGSVLGSYRILGEISTGGMGTVFRAEHVLLGRAAAVKVLRSELTTDDELVQRFVNEAKAVTACKHPGIVEVYDFGYTSDGHAFIVMELLEGESLGQRLARTRLPEAEAAAIAYGIASALKAAHKVGVIHRDLKPDNVFLVPDPDGGFDRTKVLDFGIAKLADRDPAATRHTQTGILMGTPLYMAPEQAREASTIDPRADLYSLGCILYQMLVGRPPFVADGAGEIIALQLFGEVEAPSRLAQVTPGMEWLVLRLLEKEPADRFDSAAALATALSAFDTLRVNRSSWPPVPAGVAGGAGFSSDARFSDLAPTLPPDHDDHGGHGAPALGTETRPGFARSAGGARFGDTAPTLPPDHRMVELGHEARPELAPAKRSAIPIVAGVITVLAVAVGGLAYLTLRGGDDAPPPLGSVTPANGVTPATPPPLPQATPPAPIAPAATPGLTATPATHDQPAMPGTSDQPGMPSKPDKPDKPDKPGRHVPRGAPAGHVATHSAPPTDAPGSGPVTRPQPDSALPDRAIEVIRDIRQVDPPKQGEHTANGSPIESTLETDRKPPKPVAAEAPKTVLPSSESPKDPSQP